MDRPARRGPPPVGRVDDRTRHTRRGGAGHRHRAARGGGGAGADRRAGHPRPCAGPAGRGALPPLEHPDRRYRGTAAVDPAARHLPVATGRGGGASFRAFAAAGAAQAPADPWRYGAGRLAGRRTRSRSRVARATAGPGAGRHRRVYRRATDRVRLLGQGRADAGAGRAHLRRRCAVFARAARLSARMRAGAVRRCVVDRAGGARGRRIPVGL